MQFSKNDWFDTNIAIEHGPVEIVSFPIQNGGSFHRFFVGLRGRVIPSLTAAVFPSSSPGGCTKQFSVALWGPDVKCEM